MTCHLGHSLSDGDGHPLFSERRLLRLARLPWFRHAQMPDWLRFKLIAGMDRGERERVWGCLRKLLVEAVRATGPDSDLEIAQEPLKGRKDHRLSHFLTRQADDSPLRDYLFLSFMRGRKPYWLTLAARRPLRTLIRDADRWSVLASALLALSLTAVVALAHRITAVVAAVVTAVVAAGAPAVDYLVVAYLRAAPPSFPEGTILVVNPLLALLVVALHALKRGRFFAGGRRFDPAAGDLAVAGLIERVRRRPLQTLLPLFAVLWVSAFMLAANVGGPLVAAATLVGIVLVAFLYVCWRLKPGEVP